MSQDDLSYEEWLPRQINIVEINETNRAMLLAETKPCPKDGKDTGVVLDDEAEKILMILALLRREYKISWNEFQLLTPGDQKVLPFQRLVLLEVRIRMTEDLLCLGMRTLLPTWTYAHKEIGVDTNFCIWVGGQVYTNLTDLSRP